MESAKPANPSAWRQEFSRQGAERRAAPRFPVESAGTLRLLSTGASQPCRILEISLGGCRVLTRDRFLAGIRVRVEISFHIRGFLFRFIGVTEWTDRRHLAGIRFVDVSPRRWADLVEALREVEAECEGADRPTAQLDAADDPAGAEPCAGLSLPEAAADPPASIPEAPIAAPQPEPDAALPAPEAAAQEMSPSAGSARERRADSRHGVDTSAAIHVVRTGSRLDGRILDLSLSGCRIRTLDRFPLGIYTRAEAEFRVDGLPFRLSGVVQAIHDRHSIGIRFLDVSARKQEQLERLIEELEVMRGEREPRP